MLNSIIIITKLLSSNYEDTLSVCQSMLYVSLPFIVTG